MGEELYGKLLAVTGEKERILFYLNEFNTDYQRPMKLDALLLICIMQNQALGRSSHRGAIPLQAG